MKRVTQSDIPDCINNLNLRIRTYCHARHSISTELTFDYGVSGDGVYVRQHCCGGWGYGGRPDSRF